VRDREAVEAATAGVGTIVHCVAAQPVSRSKRSVLHDVNVRGTASVLAAALRHGVRRVVAISSSATYGLPLATPIHEYTRFNPVCAYGRSKVDAEHVCRRYRSLGLDVVILRPRVLLGSGRLGVYQMLFNWIADGKPIYIVGSGRQPFQALSVHDMVEACLSALDGDCDNQDFNLGACRYDSFRRDLRRLMDYAGNRKPIVSLPAVPAKALLATLDACDLSPLTAWHYMTVDASFYFDCSKAWELLGWMPRHGNIDMLIESYDWYLNHRSEVDRDYGVTHKNSVPQRALRWLKLVN
jgi:nucleoside-diphosphate-sugar epimerase